MVWISGFNFSIGTNPWSVVTGVPAGKHIGTGGTGGADASVFVVTVLPKKDRVKETINAILEDRG